MQQVNPFSSSIRSPFAAVAARWITTKLYDGIDPNNDNFKDLRDRRDKSGESCGADVDDSSFHISNVDNECAISESVERARTRGTCFCSISSLPFPARQGESRCKTRKTTGGLGSFSGRSVGTVHTKGLQSIAPPLCYHRRHRQRFPSQTRCFPSLLSYSLPYSLARSAKRHIRRC